jgi:hypothetical protein
MLQMESETKSGSKRLPFFLTRLLVNSADFETESTLGSLLDDTDRGLGVLRVSVGSAIQAFALRTAAGALSPRSDGEALVQERTVGDLGKFNLHSIQASC